MANNHRYKTADELMKKYAKKDLIFELQFTATHTITGYLPREYAEYYSWLALAAYRRIKELEEKEG